MKKGWFPICGGTPWMDSIGEQLLIGTLSEKPFTLSAQWIISRKTMSAAITVDDDDEQVAYRRLVITPRILIFIWVNAGRNSSYWDLRILRCYIWTYCVLWERIHMLRQNSFTWLTQKTMVTAWYIHQVISRATIAWYWVKSGHRPCIMYIIRPIYERRGCGYMMKAKLCFSAGICLMIGREVVKKKRKRKYDLNVAVFISR